MSHTPPNPIHWYDAHASEVSSRYEAVAADAVHEWLLDLLPPLPALVLDVGAGTGRDAAWLAARGYEVVAIEPSHAMRAEAGRLHPKASIRWAADALPGLEQTLRLGLSFDLILLSAVWMHASRYWRPSSLKRRYVQQYAADVGLVDFLGLGDLRDLSRRYRFLTLPASEKPELLLSASHYRRVVVREPIGSCLWGPAHGRV